MNYSIYQTTNQKNGKRYIRFTTRTVEERWKEHLNTGAMFLVSRNKASHYKGFRCQKV